jgi:hypothetical protein
VARLTITSARLIHPRPYGRIPASSTEELLIAVEGAGLDLGQRTYIALMTIGGQPGAPDWKRARWTENPPAGAQFVIEAMIGPQSPIRVGKGDRRIWVRVDNPPVSSHRHAGHLVFI